MLSILVYSYFYMVAQEAPGHDAAHIEGWWGWFDQGQYLKAAIAFGNGDFSPSSHYYPPMYPYIGHLFYCIIPRDPFFFIDGAAFVFFSYTFVKIASEYIGFTLSIIAFYFSVAFNYETIKHFIIPWTTTMTIMAYSACLLSLSILNKCSTASKKELIYLPLLMSTGMTFLGLSRPIDALLAGVFFLAYLILLYKKSNQLVVKDKIKDLAPALTIFIIGPLIAIAIYAAFNEKVFGTPLGGYVDSTATSSGYFITELIQKSVSLLLDSGSLYATPGEGIVEHYPWIAVAFAGIILCFFIGDAFLRILAIALVIHFCLYAPYGDLQPVGVWRYGNIHYFKWGMPYLMLLALVTLYWCIPKKGIKKVRTLGVPLFVMGFSVLALSLSFNASKFPQKAQLDGLNLKINYDVPANVKFIDIPGVVYDYTAIYFGNHKLWNGDKEMRKIRDFRMIPTPAGTRIYFNKPIHTEGIRITFDDRITFKNDIKQVESGYYKYIFSTDKLLSHRLKIQSGQN